MEDFVERMKDINPETISLHGLDDCIIGIVEGYNVGPVFLYDTRMILDIFMYRDGMSEEEALKYYHYNILGAYMSEYNPIFTYML